MLDNALVVKGKRGKTLSSANTMVSLPSLGAILHWHLGLLYTVM